MTATRPKQKKRTTKRKEASKPRKVAAPAKRLKIDPGMIEWVRAQGNRSSEQPVGNPFALPKFPAIAMPKDPKLAMDAQLRGKLAMDDAAFNAGTWGTGNGALGLYGYGTFLGYPELAVLAQRVEYRQIVTTIAREATREWIEFAVDGVAPEESKDDELKDRVKRLEDELGRLGAQGAFCTCAEYDGYYGRGHLYIDTGSTNDPAELVKPLVADKAKLPKGILSIRPIEAVWVYPINYEAVDPLRADWYNPTVWYVMGKNVHASRLLRFVGHEVPDLLKPAYSFGGLSLTQLCKPYVDIWLQTRQSVADLIRNFSMVWLATDLSVDLAPSAGGADFQQRMELFNLARNNLGVMALEKDQEELGNVAVPLGGLHELQSQSQEHMCSASGQPAVELLGVQPAGFNASSDGELDAWQRRVKSFQTRVFGAPLKQLVELCQVALWGEIDKRISWKFKPLKLMTPKEKAEIQKIKAEVHDLNLAGGVVSQEEVRQSVADDPDSLYDGLVVDDIPEQSEGKEDMDITGFQPGPENEGV